MKIVFVNRYYAPDHSATSQMVTDLATALAAGGADVQVVTSRQRYDDPAASLPRFELIRGVSVDRVYSTTFGRTSLPGRALDYLSFYIAAFLRLLRLVKRGDVIVAKTDPPLISVPAGWVARIRGALLVNWLQDLFPEVAVALGVASARGAAGRLLHRLRDRSLRGAAANVVLGELMRERVTALGVDPAKIAVIPNWADGTLLRLIDRATNALRVEWGLTEKFVVGYSGNMGRAHEFQTVLDAAESLRTQEDVAFLFIGGGAQTADLTRAAEGRGLSNITFKPYQPQAQLARSLSAVDVHVVTLRPELEGLIVPSKFYGIAAVGRPTIFIGDPQGEIGSVIRAADCGICVKEGDAAGLVAAIEALRDDPDLRQRMGANARRVFEERYDKAIAVEQWRLLLASVAATK